MRPTDPAGRQTNRGHAAEGELLLQALGPGTQVPTGGSKPRDGQNPWAPEAMLHAQRA
jgi:hypothetical protein